MKKLRYLGWEGYADGHFAEGLLSETGVQIQGYYHLSDNEAARLLGAMPSAWDIINLNTPFVRDVLYPANLVKALPEKFSEATLRWQGPFARFSAAAESTTGALLGVPQRCGPFNFVINDRRISAELARAEGFGLALDLKFRHRFGILAYQDFNVMHFALAAGLNPFQPMSEVDRVRFHDAARKIFTSAKIVTSDHNTLNRALVDGDIDLYISGGPYTASKPRLAGCLEVLAITPATGPIDGKGGVAFVEMNAVVRNLSRSGRYAEAFLDFIASDDGAHRSALAAGACNPVVQMSRPSLFSRFTNEQLQAMQWNDLEEDLSRCAEYALIPDYAHLSTILRAAAQTSNVKIQ